MGKQKTKKILGLAIVIALVSVLLTFYFSIPLFSESAKQLANNGGNYETKTILTLFFIFLSSVLYLVPADSDKTL
jgi:hypothetical protein